MRRVTLSMLGVCLVALLVGVAQADTIYSFANCFYPSTAAPPNANPYTDSQGGVWGFGYYSAANPVPSTYTAFNIFGTDNTGLIAWETSVGGAGNVMVAEQYTSSGSTGGTWDPSGGGGIQKYHELWPIASPELVTRGFPLGITWTAPAAGTVTLNVTYEATDSTAYTNYTSGPWAQSELFQNSTVVDPPVAITSYEGTSVLTNVLTVAAGDVLTFMALTSDSSHTSITASNAAILSTSTIDFAPAPEPSSIVLLVCGLVGLSAYAWRKRR